MNYFSFISHSYSCTNTLQNAILEYLNFNNRIYIEDSAFDAFKNKILDDIEVLNKKHPRCKPITPHWYQIGRQKDLHLQDLPGICNFYIYQSNN